jgi:hypothetical protein
VGHSGAFWDALNMAAATPSDANALPVACTLGAIDGAERLRRWRALPAPTLRREEGSLEARWTLEGELADELAALVAGERECCGFVAWRLRRDGAESVLLVTGAPEGVAAIAAYLASL